MADKTPGTADPEMLKGMGLNIAVVVARFNYQITYKMRDLCVNRLLELGVQHQAITVDEVPGSFELPVMVNRRLSKGMARAAIAIGAVIRGETDHYEHISRAAADGLQRVALDTGRPVIFGVLTTDTVKQARARTKHAVGYAENAVEMAHAWAAAVRQR